MVVLYVWNASGWTFREMTDGSFTGTAKEPKHRVEIRAVTYPTSRGGDMAAMLRTIPTIFFFKDGFFGGDKGKGGRGRKCGGWITLEDLAGWRKGGEEKSVEGGSRTSVVRRYVASS